MPPFPQRLLPTFSSAFHPFALCFFIFVSLNIFPYHSYSFRICIFLWFCLSQTFIMSVTEVTGGGGGGGGADHSMSQRMTKFCSECVPAPQSVPGAHPWCGYGHTVWCIATYFHQAQECRCQDLLASLLTTLVSLVYVQGAPPKCTHT